MIYSYSESLRFLEQGHDVSSPTTEREKNHELNKVTTISPLDKRTVGVEGRLSKTLVKLILGVYKSMTGTEEIRGQHETE